MQLLIWCCCSKCQTPCATTVNNFSYLPFSLCCLCTTPASQRDLNWTLRGQGWLPSEQSSSGCHKHGAQNAAQWGKCHVSKRRVRIGPQTSYNKGDLALQSSPPTNLWKMSPGRADFDLPQFLWHQFSLCCFCSSKTFLYTACCITGQWKMLATKCWATALAGVDDMRLHCSCVWQTKCKITLSKRRQRNPANHLIFWRNFCYGSWGALNKFVLKHRIISGQCTGQSPTTISDSARSLHRRITSQFLIYTCISTNRQPKPWFCAPLQLCCPVVTSERSHSRMATRQNWGCFLPHHQVKVHSLTGSSSVSGIPVSSQFDRFLQVGLLALHARWRLGHKSLLSS